MYRFNKASEARRKGHAIICNLSDERRRIQEILHTHQPYDEWRKYERIIDSLTRAIDDVRRSLL